MLIYHVVLYRERPRLWFAFGPHCDHSQEFIIALCLLIYLSALFRQIPILLLATFAATINLSCCYYLILEYLRLESRFNFNRGRSMNFTV